jgi:hypothetical protein
VRLTWEFHWDFLADNPETLVTLDTQDRMKTKKTIIKKKNTTQETEKDEQHGFH